MLSSYNFETNNWSQERYDKDILFNSEGVHQPQGRHKTNSAREQFEEIIPYLNKTRNALDIGARWGSFTVQLHKFGFKHVYMAELRHIHFAGISYNVDMTRATLFPHPIMHKTGVVSTMQKTITGIDKGSIKCYSIDDMKIDDVDFIKIDVDGPDRLVVQGAQKTIEKCKPIMYVEYGDEQKQWERKMKNRTVELKDLVPSGYNVVNCKVESNNYILVP